MSCCLASRSRRLTCRSPRARRFFSLVPKPMFWFSGQWNSIPVFPNHFWMSIPVHNWRVLLRVPVVVERGLFLVRVVRVIVQTLSHGILQILPTFLRLLGLGLLGFFCSFCLCLYLWECIPRLRRRPCRSDPRTWDQLQFSSIYTLVAPEKATFFQPPLLLVDGLDEMGVLGLFFLFFNTWFNLSTHSTHSFNCIANISLSPITHYAARLYKPFT